MKKIIAGLLLVSISLLAKDVSTYLTGEFQSTDAVKSALSSNGFKIVGEYDAMGDANYHVVAYTCPGLSKLASKETRGFAAVQKVLIDKKDKTIVATNPEYFMEAFLQGDNDTKISAKVASKLTTALGELKGGELKLEDDDIEGYHFMMGMPYYEDMIEIAEGKDLASKLEKNAKGNIVYKLTVGDAKLYGVAMPTENGEKSYVNAIEAQKHLAFLPYMVLIEDNKAKILHGKFYLAVSNPNLSMGDFMGISSTPDDIEDYMTNLVTQ